MRYQEIARNPSYFQLSSPLRHSAVLSFRGRRSTCAIYTATVVQ